MANKNAGENKSVTITGSLGLDGTDAGNYELTQPTFDNVTVNITKKSLSVEGDLKADDKVYDGTTDIVLNTAELELTETEIIEGDAVSLTNGTLIGTMANKNAGENKSVTITGTLGLAGTDAENYVLTQPTFDNVTVDIAKKELSVEGALTAENKEYDGTTNVELNAAGLGLTGLINEDDVELKTTDLIGTMDDKNVGTGKTVTIEGTFALNGTDAENYVLRNYNFDGVTVNVIPVPAEFVWSDKTDFDYDGNTHEITAIVQNKKSEDDIFNLKYDNNTAKNSGDYVAKVIDLGNENYTLEDAKNTEKTWSIKNLYNNIDSDGGNLFKNSSVAENKDNGIGFFSWSSSVPSQNNLSRETNDTKTNILIPFTAGTNDVTTTGKTLKDIVVPIGVKQKKYINGYSDGTFRPNENMTRAEFTQTVYNLINNSEPVDIDVLDKFNDVDKKAWYAKAMAYLVEKNIIKGYDGKIKSNDFVTRGEIAQILFNVLKLYDNARMDNYIYGNYDSSFIDLDNNDWASTAIKQLASNGMLNGYENKTFRPKANVTRAEVVAMISKVFGRSFDLNVTKEYIDVEKNHWAYNYILDASE